jgi:hypothetical protein
VPFLDGTQLENAGLYDAILLYTYDIPLTVTAFEAGLRRL